MISQKLGTAINAQVGHELGASHQYIAIAIYFDQEGLPALAQHFYKQSVEERGHAMRFVKFLIDAGGDVKVPAIPAPKTGFKSAADAVKLALESEIRVTAQINALVDQAIADKDHGGRNALEWFVNEQREEMASMDTLLRMVKRAGEHGLFFVENFLLQGGLDEEGGEPAAGT
jgi:ferritin